MLDTPANRALVNRGIAEARDYYEIQSHKDGSVTACKKKPDHTWEWERLDYTRDLNACYEVCEECSINFASILVVEGVMAGKDADLRWLVAMAVWEALKSDATSSTTPQNTDS